MADLFWDMRVSSGAAAFFRLLRTAIVVMLFENVGPLSAFDEHI